MPPHHSRAIAALRAKVARLEEREATLAAALREFGHHDQDCEGHRQKFDDLEHCHCGLSLALSDTQTGTAGKGWPEVREQAREAIEWVMKRATPAGEGAWRIPRTSLERLGAILVALKEVK